MTLTWLGQEARTEGCSTGKCQVFGPLCCGVGGDIGDSDDDQRGLDLTWGENASWGNFSGLIIQQLRLLRPDRAHY